MPTGDPYPPFCEHPVPVMATAPQSMWEPKTAMQLALLAAAEESFCQAATVLKPVIAEVEHLVSCYGDTSAIHRLATGLHLLEEGMRAHNRYMQSLR